MKLFIKISFILFFLILYSNSALAADWEYWSNYPISVKLTDKIDFRFIQQFRLNDHFGRFYLYKNYIGPAFKLNEHLKISPLYEYKISRNTGGWKPDNIGNLDADLKLFDSLLSCRFRLEYSFTNSQCVSRNKFKLSKKIPKIGGLSFFVWDEIFYNFKVHKLNENRSSVGFSKDINKHLTFDLSYILRYRKADSWYNSNILQTDLKIKF